MASDPIYHICRGSEWEAARRAGTYGGSTQDMDDGFIHFSSRDQVEASAAKHRAGQTGLVLLSVDPRHLGEALKWEPAGDGQLFPHLHGSLPLEAVTRVTPLSLGEDGRHRFPEDF
jgi:uncharacterized protein (DUF952 family)